MGGNDLAWRIWSGGEIALRYWDGDYVVYNSLTGNTHVLDTVAGEVLNAIRAGRGQWSELCRSVADFLDVPNDAAVADNVRKILAQLDELGLIEPADGC
jgi:PqqD family protein of HPr-rel-A system